MSYLTWPVSIVVEQLNSIDLGQYAPNFEKNDISGAVLPLLRDDHLKELGMKVIGHRLKFLKFVKSLERGSVPLQPERKRQPAPSHEEAPHASNTPSTASNWEQKRRQMMLKKMQAEKHKQSDPEEEYEQPKPKKPAPVKKPPSRNLYDEVSDDDEPPPKKPIRKPAPAAAPPPQPYEDDPNDDRVECAYCHRKFAADRIAKHEEVCARMSTKKKKVFDGSKMRLQGTEAAKYVTKESKQPEKRKPSKYKQEHEKLVQALQAARKIQEYEKAKEQGKAVGPPPELPKYEMEDDDRVQCPYCGRKFGSEVAQKHIAVCERMNGNKMRGGAANRRGGRR